jgi:hypothetical protein
VYILESYMKINKNKWIYWQNWKIIV